MKYRFERVSNESLNGLEALFASVYHENAPNLSGLKERFNTSIFGCEYIGYLAYPLNNASNYIQDMPVAYYGVFPQIAELGNDKILCAQSGDTMTHPQHQGRGLFTQLALKTYDLARETGIEFIFGFPSKFSYPGFKKKLAWEFPYNMSQFIRTVPTLPWGLIKRRYNLKLLNQRRSNFLLRFLKDENTNVIYEINDKLDNSKFRLLRNEVYLKYKAGNPLNKWLIKQNNLYALVKFDGDLKIGEIIGEPDELDLSKLMKKLDLYAFCLGACRIISFFSPNSHYSEMLNKYGKISDSIPYGYINLSKKYDPSKLNLKFIDFDYF